MTTPETTCVGTLVRSNKVLSLTECVGGVPEASIRFVARNGSSHSVSAVTYGHPIADDAPTEEPWAMLTLEHSVEGQWLETALEGIDESPIRGSAAWLATFGPRDEAPTLLACARGDGLTAPSCGTGGRRLGGIIFTTNGATLVGLGIDRGHQVPPVEYWRTMNSPDRVADIAVHVAREWGSIDLQLHAVDPDWRRVATWAGDWGRGWDTPFSAVAVATFTANDEPQYVVASRQGALWASGWQQREVDTPVAVRRVEALTFEDETVLWVLGQDGAVCRQAWLPRAHAWRCPETITEAADFSVLRTATHELVVVASKHGVYTLAFDGETFDELRAWGLEGESCAAVELSQLSDDTPYALLAHGDEALSFRVLGDDDWGSWQPFPAGGLGSVEALAGGHVPGWPERLFALAGGRLYRTQQILPASSTDGDGDGERGDGGAAHPVRFTRWR